MEFIAVIMVVLAVSNQKVAGRELEYNRTAEDYSDYTPYGSLGSFPTCEEIIALIHFPIHLTLTCISIATCMAAFLVYFRIRKKIFTSQAVYERKDIKHWIHFNFIISFILRDVAILITMVYQRSGKHILLTNKSPLAAYTFYTYINIANFYWMFNEGLWLYLGVFFDTEFKHFSHMKVKLSLFGWLLPAFLMSVWAAVEAVLYRLDNRKIWTPSEKGFWEPASVVCILVPVYLILFVNLIMMIRLLRHFKNMIQRELKVKRRLARATFILSFLLGINFAIPSIVFSLHLSEIETNPCAENSIKFLNFIVSSLQGFFVAIFYVLSNKDVLQFFKTQIQEDITSVSPRVSRSSRTSRISQTSSRPSGASQIESPAENGFHINGLERPLRTSRTLQSSSTLQVPPSPDFRKTSRSSGLSTTLYVPSHHAKSSKKTSNTSELSVTLYVPSPDAKSKSTRFSFLSKADEPAYV